MHPAPVLAFTPWAVVLPWSVGGSKDVSQGICPGEEAVLACT